MKRSDVLWLVSGAAVGFLVLAGALLLDGGTASIGLLLPLGVLLGGLLWSLDAARSESLPMAACGGGGSEESDHSVPPVVIGDPSAVDAPTVMPVSASVADDDTTTEAVRLDAARTFPLDSYLLEENSDRVQCDCCGRYDRLTADSDRRITCGACGGARQLGGVQPDTRVRLFADDADSDSSGGLGTVEVVAFDPEADAVRAPTEPSLTATSMFAPPTTPRGG